jgi:peptidyl-prolyl cis-trans isomerase C
MLIRTVVGVALASLWWSGCGPKLDGDVVAKVGDEEIKLAALRQFREESTANYRDPEERQAWRFYLQTMIDMKLMLIEARERRLDQTVEFVRQWERERRKKLVDEYAVRTILADVDLAVEGMRQGFATSKWNRMLRLAHIRTASAAEAQKAMRDLEQGRDFAAVARERSIAPTAAHGGVLDAWYGRGNLEEVGLPIEVGEQVFDLQVGDLSQPLLVGEHYEIFKVLSQGPAPEHYRAAFLREQYWKEFRVRWQELTAQLKDRLNAQLDGEAIRLLVDRMAESDSRGMLLGPEEQEVILCRFKGGQVTLRDFAETYNAYWFIRSVSFDSRGFPSSSTGTSCREPSSIKRRCRKAWTRIRP